MPIYERPVRQLMKDFVGITKITKGQVVTRDEIISWFKTRYPKIKLGTITAHIIKMAVNAPSRVHYNVNLNGDDDLFYQIDGGHFRLFDAETDPPPIYEKGQAEKVEIQQVEEALEEEIAQSTGFAYESDLRNFLSKNLAIIEPGLHVV